MVEKSKSRGRPRKFDPAEALDKAVEVFWELGYEAADTETLAKRMGLSKPSLYNAFGPKEDLFLAALDRYGATVSQASITRLTSTPDPKEAFYAFFRAIAEATAGEGHPSGCLVACVAVPLSGRMPRVAEVLNAQTRGGMEPIEAYLNDHMARGTLPASFDIPAALALLGDLSLAMGVQGRAQMPLADLQKRARRNADLVMIEGMRDR